MARIEDLKFYTLADAKARFSKVVEEAAETDVVVTKNGVPAVVIIDYSKYLEMSRFVEDVHDVFLMDVGDPSKTEFMGSSGAKKMVEDNEGSNDVEV